MTLSPIALYIQVSGASCAPGHGVTTSARMVCWNALRSASALAYSEYSSELKGGAASQDTDTRAPASAPSRLHCSPAGAKRSSRATSAVVFGGVAVTAAGSDEVVVAAQPVWVCGRGAGQIASPQRSTTA